MRDQLSEDPQLARFYINILHPASRAFEKIERRGVYVNEPKYRALGEEVAAVIQESQDKAMSLLPAKMRIKYRDRIDDQIAQGKKPAALDPEGIFLLAQRAQPQAQGPHRQDPRAVHGQVSPEAVWRRARGDGDDEALTVMDGASKTKSTFIDGFLKHLRPDGLHPTYMLFGGLWTMRPTRAAR
jgi:hypothetical protein